MIFRVRFVSLCFCLLSFVTLVTMGYGVGQSTHLQVTAKDFEFSPKKLVVGIGENISISLTNHGVQEHEWAASRGRSLYSMTVTLPFNEDDKAKIFWKMEAGAGETREERFMAPSQSGTYLIVCGKPRHIERGMTATLVVE